MSPLFLVIFPSVLQASGARGATFVAVQADCRAESISTIRFIQPGKCDPQRGIFVTGGLEIFERTDGNLWLLGLQAGFGQIDRQFEAVVGRSLGRLAKR